MLSVADRRTSNKYFLEKKPLFAERRNIEERGGLLLPPQKERSNLDHRILYLIPAARASQLREFIRFYCSWSLV